MLNKIKIFFVSFPFLFAPIACLKNPSNDEKLLKTVQSVHTSIAYGTAPDYSAQGIEKFGSGHCGQLSMVLATKLSVIGGWGRMIGDKGNQDLSHGYLEVLLNGKLYIADAATGLVYEHSHIELFRNPKLANQFTGQPPKKLSAYFGEKYFSSIVYSKFDNLGFRNYYNRLTTFTLNKPRFQIPPGTHELEISWKNNFDVEYIELENRSEQKYLISRSYSDQFILVDKQTIYLPVSNEELKNQKLVIKVQNPNLKKIEFNTKLDIKASNLDPYIQVFSPRPISIYFKKDPIDIDTISLLQNEKKVLMLDIGLPKDENTPNIFLYSKENSSFKDYDWSPIRTENNINYRTAQNNYALTKHLSLVDIYPQIEKESLHFPLRMNICYRSTSQSEVEIHVQEHSQKFDLPAQKTFSCRLFVLCDALIKNLYP